MASVNRIGFLLSSLSMPIIRVLLDVISEATVRRAMPNSAVGQLMVVNLVAAALLDSANRPTLLSAASGCYRQIRKQQ
jgi:hypothetical protein